MKKMVMILSIGLLGVGFNVQAYVHVWFLNHKDNAPVHITLTHSSPINECMFGPDCRAKASIVKEFDVSPGEIVQADGSWQNFHANFYRKPQEGERADYTQYKDSDIKVEWKEFYADSDPLSNNIASETLYTIGKKYEYHRWNGYWGDWKDFDGISLWNKKQISK